MSEAVKKSRRAVLEEFLASHPKDGFARYGLAMECVSQGDSDAAIANFQALLADHPDYVSGYFQYGQFLARRSSFPEARRILTQGIETARRNGDHHAASEMEAALSQLPPS
ncbi:MAG TPA: tetratricopeptide repeat protein [Terriglobia bacterium]|nr:tetratricopeptide repeat protein [Terriglobia bacterium]